MNPNTKQTALDLIVECKKKSWEQNPLASKVLSVLETAVNETPLGAPPAKPTKPAIVPLVLVALLAGMVGAATSAIIQSAHYESVIDGKNAEIIDLRAQNKVSRELLTKSVLSDADAVKAAVIEAKNASDQARKASEGMKAALDNFQTHVRVQTESETAPVNPAKKP